MIFFFFFSALCFSQQKPLSDDQLQLPALHLPDVLQIPGGSLISDTVEWQKKARPALLSIFETEVYGYMPRKKLKTRYITRSVTVNAMNGLAVRKELVIRLSAKRKQRDIDVLMYLPMSISGPVAVFLGLNFCGNHCIHPDSSITMAHSWMADKYIQEKNQELVTSRGIQASRWPVEQILERGYGLVTVYYGDLYPDYPGGESESVLPLLDLPVSDAKTGAIGIWAWGLSLVMDCLVNDREIDPSRVFVIGHSRLGKAALWAAANDTRFAMAISNNSGCGGAKIFRHNFGESVEIITTKFPHWFCNNFKKYNGREDALPVDQHQLLALIAPRPVYIASASDDANADPAGELLAALNVAPVYRLYQKQTLPLSVLPPVNTPFITQIGYHLRQGKHDITPWDWQRFLDFADQHFGNR